MTPARGSFLLHIDLYYLQNDGGYFLAMWNNKGV